MARSDHYRTLGVARFASAARVRHAYVLLMKGHHDAAGPTLSDDRVRAIGQAYWVLRHPERRADYDAALRQHDRRRTAAGKAVRGRATARIQLPPPRGMPRRGTRALFLFSLALLVGGVGWVASQRSPPRRPAPVAAAAYPRGPVERQQPRQAMIDEAFADYRQLLAEGGRAGVARYVGQCFDDMRATAPQALFDYCVALDGLAGIDAGGDDGFFDEGARRARAARAAFEPAASALERWEAVNRAVTVRAWPEFSTRSAGPPGGG